jgi:hypothetical protein
MSPRAVTGSSILHTAARIIGAAGAALAVLLQQVTGAVIARAEQRNRPDQQVLQTMGKFVVPVYI